MSILVSSIGYSQSGDKTVTLTVSGQGTTLDKARQSALRTAIEQAFGTFISSKTEILNDELVADQITSVSTGNIQSYEILNEAELPNGTWAATLKAVVSVEKLTSFVQSKGYEVVVKGGLFTLNIKQQLLNEQGEVDAICELVGVLHEPMQTAFDYLINNGEPKSLDAESKNWEIPLEVYTVANTNLDVCMDYFLKTINSIALTPAEIESYQKLNKKTFPVEVVSDGEKKVLYFRKAKTIRALLGFINNWEFYTTLFEVNDGLKNSNYHNIDLDFYIGEGYNEFAEYRHIYLSGEQSWLLPFGEYYDYGLSDMQPYHSRYYFRYDSYRNEELIDYPGLAAGKIRVKLFHSRDTIARFVWKDRKTLEEIEKLEKFTVKSSGVKSEFKFGGYVVHEDSGHGLVASLFDIDCDIDDKSGEAKLLSLTNVDSICSLHKYSGYKDWVVPGLDDMKVIFEKLSKNSISMFHVLDFYSFKEGWNNPVLYLTNSDTGIVFLNKSVQNESEYYINLMINPTSYRTPEEVIKEQNIIRSIDSRKFALIGFANSSSRGRLRPVRKF